MSSSDYNCVPNQENYNSLQRIANDYASSNEETRNECISGMYVTCHENKIKQIIVLHRLRRRN